MPVKSRASYPPFLILKNERGISHDIGSVYVVAGSHFAFESPFKLHTIILFNT